MKKDTCWWLSQVIWVLRHLTGCGCNTQEAEAGELLQFWGHPGFHYEFKVTLNYIVRNHFKQTNEQTEVDAY